MVYLNHFKIFVNYYFSGETGKVEKVEWKGEGMQEAVYSKNQVMFMFIPYFPPVLSLSLSLSLYVSVSEGKRCRGALNAHKDHRDTQREREKQESSSSTCLLFLPNYKTWCIQFLQAGTNTLS